MNIRGERLSSPSSSNKKEEKRVLTKIGGWGKKIACGGRIIVICTNTRRRLSRVATGSNL